MLLGSSLHVETIGEFDSPDCKLLGEVLTCSEVVGGKHAC